MVTFPHPSTTTSCGIDRRSPRLEQRIEPGMWNRADRPAMAARRKTALMLAGSTPETLHALISGLPRNRLPTVPSHDMGPAQEGRQGWPAADRA